MAALALRHVTFITSGKVFVVDGPPLMVEAGVVTVDLSKPLNALGLWHNGYRINEETGEEIRTPGDLEALIASLTDDTEQSQDPDDTEQGQDDEETTEDEESSDDEDPSEE